MEDKIYLDKIADWMGFNDTEQMMLRIRHEDITVKLLRSENIEDYYQRTYLVTEKENDISYSIYILRIFGFKQYKIFISEDYSDNLSFDELIKNLDVIIKTVVDKIE